MNLLNKLKSLQQISTVGLVILFLAITVCEGCGKKKKTPAQIEQVSDQGGSMKTQQEREDQKGKAAPTGAAGM